MGRSYRQCTECGKRALSIATRCPGCGRELKGPVAQAAPAVGSSLDLRRFLSPGVVGGTIAATAFLAAAVTARPSRPVESSLVAADSTSTLSDVAYTTAAAARLDTARAARLVRTTATRLDTATAAPLPSARAGEVLVTRTWTHVRHSRSKGSDVDAVLLPGDTVLADSLESGWYRVALDGEVLGYVHRSTLTHP
jgi:hypothetical protein